MKKYLSIFRISFQQEFVYRLNFIMWRVRNVINILLIFFLWSSVFSDPTRVVFGYNRDKILTYVFGILVLRAIVLSARAVDVAGEIGRGDLTNYLLKPVSYFKYWFTRDLSSKLLNIAFAVVEVTLLFLILRPPIMLQTNPLLILAFLLALVLAIVLFFAILFLVNMVAFWMPENGWAAQFLFIVIITEFLSGLVFPIDILPKVLQNILYALPFPYLVFFPLQVYLGNLGWELILKGLLISLSWVVLLLLAVKKIWPKGIKAYEAVGR